MKIKMILTDLDGTLYGADRSVSKVNIEALLEAQSRGILIVPASGRTFLSVAGFAKSAGLNGPVISCNGARVDLSPDGPIVLSDTFDIGAAKALCDILSESGVYFALYGREKIYRHNMDARKPSTLRGLSLIAGEKTADDAFHISGTERMYAEGIYEAFKFVAFSDDERALLEVKESLAPLGAEISSSWFDNIEILRTGAGKGRALFALCEQFGIRPDETMAFGDHLNDLSMLKAAGVPVAMENAEAELKRRARIIAPHHDASGVGYVINKYLCGELTL